LIQELANDQHPIYAMQFSLDGSYLAVAGGGSGLIRVWKVVTDSSFMPTDLESNGPPRMAAIFESDPYLVLEGHADDVVDLSWSKNNFLLSASMDKTVRLWHHSRNDCLGVFQHGDFVTSVSFHPKDDRLFISGSLDCRIRLWSIEERQVKAWNELPPGHFVTAVAFTSDGKIALAGSSTGVCLLFESDVSACLYF